jgi:hypothetical protein
MDQCDERVAAGQQPRDGVDRELGGGDAPAEGLRGFELAKALQPPGPPPVSVRDPDVERLPALLVANTS